MRLDAAAARDAVGGLAARLGLGVEAAAEAIVAVTNSNLATAIRLSLFEKGLDPEDFCLLSFGGAGGVHACEVADELGVPRVAFPPHASTLSAWGILGSDIVHDLTAPLAGRLDDAGDAAHAAADRLAREAAALLDEDGIPAARRDTGWSLDCRYAGQAFELTVPLPDGAAGLAAAAADFHALHRRRFSYDEPDTPVEVVALRLAARGRLEGASHAARAVVPGDGRPRGARLLLLDGAPADAAVWDRAALAPETRLAGPALVEEPYTTSFIPAGWTAVLHPSGTILAQRDGVTA
jgi:N-methylhydantoinase A